MLSKSGNTFQTFLKDSLLDLEKKGLGRTLNNQQGFQKEKIVVEGIKVLNFCSNNYLGLADDKRLTDAAVKCMSTEGMGSGASRLVCGNMPAHRKLEECIAEFKNAESCLLFSTGYMANVGIISSLFNRDDIIFCDRLNHASLIDGVVLSQARFKRYAHLEMNALEEMLRKADGFKKRCIITDSVFSMDGDIAPLDSIVELAKRYDCIVMIDEAHALGVMGKTGKGLAEHFDVEDKIDIQMGTLSKAAGCFGAYCCGSKELIEFLTNKARSFVYTTGMPPSIAASAQQAIDIIEEDTDLRNQLWENTKYMRAGLKLMGFDTLNSQTPIIPLLIKDSKTAIEFSRRLLQEGIFVSAIRPPTVPANTARLRITTMATHTKSEIDFALNKIQTIGRDLCLI